MRLSALASFAALAAALPTALAWGAAGHEIVAMLAQMHLHPAVLPLLCATLYPDSPAPNCALAAVSTWADKERMHMRWSAALHYVGALDDSPPDTCAFPGARGWRGRTDINVLHAVRNVTSLLDAYVARGGPTAAAPRELAAAQEALKFLVHFVGDMHQPLHLTGRDRGGNGAKVAWNGRHTNLHSVWDGLLIAQALRTIPRNYTRPLPVPPLEAVLRGAIYDPYVRRIMWDGVGLGEYSDVRGRWEDEVESWLDCPAPAPARRTNLFERAMQAVFGVGSRTASETDDARLCPHAWAAPIHKLNCDIIWPHALDPVPHTLNDLRHEHAELRRGFEDAELAHAHAEDAEDEMRTALAAFGRPGRNEGGLLELDTPEYAGAIAEAWLVEKLLAQGGIRLAAILNDIFVPLTM